MKKSLLRVAGIGLGLASCAVMAQNIDLPKRKPGLWETKVESAAMPGMVTTMEQCIDEKTDADMQKRSLQGNGKGDCKLTSSKKTANGWEMDSVCKQDQTTIKSHTVISGDFSSSYQMDSSVVFDPPMGGMKDMKTGMKVRYLGACKAGMQAGDMSVNGVKIGQGGAAGGHQAGAGGGQMPKMSPEDIKKMMEAMQKMKQP